MKLIVHTDGGARGNPGPAAVGVVIEEVAGDEGRETTKKLMVQFGKKIGETTNNVAEYAAVVEALRWVCDNVTMSHRNNITIQFYLDSTLVVNQINGLFKVKDARLRQLLVEVRQLEGEVGGAISYTAVPREQNRDADLMVNQALDGE